MRLVLWSVLGLTACGGTSDFEVDRKHCEQLRDHLVDLRLAGTDSSIDVTAHRAAMKQALGEGFLSSCLDHIDSRGLKCALRARDLASATACTTSK